MKREKTIKCPDCKGRGKKFDHTLCIGTFGMGYLMGREWCERCDGEGYIIVKPKR